MVRFCEWNSNLHHVHNMHADMEFRVELPRLGCGCRLCTSSFTMTLLRYVIQKDAFRLRGSLSSAFFSRAAKVSSERSLLLFCAVLSVFTPDMKRIGPWCSMSTLSSRMALPLTSISPEASRHEPENFAERMRVPLSVFGEASFSTENP